VTQERARFRAVEEEVYARYAEHRYADGIALLRAAIPELPGWRADLAHSAACLLSLTGRPAEALAELTAAFDAGAWWHRRILVEDDDPRCAAGVGRLDPVPRLGHAFPADFDDRLRSAFALSLVESKMPDSR
jgi:hypothetical protein